MKEKVKGEVVDIVLASTSPRRRDLLTQAGVAFRAIDSQVSEELPEHAWDNPEEATQTLANRKAAAVAHMLLACPEALRDTTVVIGADTVVVHRGKVFGKPTNTGDARRMLRELSGSAHQVITGVSVWEILHDTAAHVELGAEPGKVTGTESSTDCNPATKHTTFAETSHVYFKNLTEQDIDTYLTEGESMDKAGAYAIQGKGKRLVDHTQGSWDNIVGLPVAALLERFPQLVHDA